MMAPVPSEGDVLVRRAPSTPDSYMLSFVGEVSQVLCVGGANALALATEMAAVTGVKVWFTDADGTQHIVNRH